MKKFRTVILLFVFSILFFSLGTVIATPALAKSSSAVAIDGYAQNISTSNYALCLGQNNSNENLQESKQKFMTFSADNESENISNEAVTFKFSEQQKSLSSTKTSLWVSLGFLILFGILMFIAFLIHSP